MSFKSVTSLCLSAVMTLTTVGCSDYLKGEKHKPEVIEFSDARFKCLQDLPTQMKAFSVGEISQTDIESGFDCMSEALKYFNKKTFGSVEGGYTVEEIRRFFGKYFLKQNNVTPEFATELMKIKRALVGGTVEQLKKEEIAGLIEILSVIKKEAILLTPHIKILLNQTHQKKAEWEQISMATEQLRRSAKKVLEVTQIAKSDYSFEDAKKVLAGFAKFIKGEETFAPYEQYSEWVPVVEAVKNILLGRRANFTGLSQWMDALDSFVDVYELLLKYHYNLSDFEFNDALKLRQISQFLNKAMKVIAESHQMKSIGHIPVQDLDVLIDQVVPRTALNIKPASVKKVYRAILLKMLDPQRKADTRGFIGLERKHMATLQREFNVWRLIQSFVDNVPYPESTQALSQEQLVSAYKSFDKNFVIEKGLTEDPFEQQALQWAWDDYGLLLQSKIPVIFNSEGQMFVALDTAKTGQTWRSLSKANLMRGLSRMLMIGYGGNVDGALSEAGMAKEGLISWYDDFKEFFLDIGAFDPRAGNSGDRSFQEANFFTFSGNGDSSMDQAEAYEFVSTLFAAGLASSESLQAGLMKVCATETKDLFGRPFLKQDCFQRELKARFAVYFSNVPGMAAYIKSLNDKQWAEFFAYLLTTSATPDQKAGLIDTANVRTMTTILHYVENLMTIYDADQNQTFSLDEVYAAAPRFMSFLKTVKPGTPDTFLTEGFAYLVFKGAIPGPADLVGFQFTKKSLPEASRMNILRIFGALKDQLNKPQK